MQSSQARGWEEVLSLVAAFLLSLSFPKLLKTSSILLAKASQSFPSALDSAS